MSGKTGDRIATSSSGFGTQADCANAEELLNLFEQRHKLLTVSECPMSDEEESEDSDVLVTGEHLETSSAGRTRTDTGPAHPLPPSAALANMERTMNRLTAIQAGRVSKKKHRSSKSSCPKTSVLASVPGMILLKISWTHS